MFVVTVLIRNLIKANPYRMLEDPAFSSIVCWGSQRDCFIVKDMTEFTKVILPRLFKHSNFASFVRQLNKYDFHKVCFAPAPAPRF